MMEMQREGSFVTEWAQVFRSGGRLDRDQVSVTTRYRWTRAAWLSVGTTAFNPTTLSVTGSITVTNGDGFDTTKIGDGATTNAAVTGTVRIINGAGGSTNNLVALTAATVGAGLSVTAVDGNDAVTMLRTTISGATMFNLGAGSDT